MARKITALVLSCVILLTLCPSAWATDEVAKGSLGENITWTLDGSGELTITGTGTMTNYAAEESPLWKYREKIELAFIKSGITTVGSNVFYGCMNMTIVSISDTVVDIDVSAFEQCSGLSYFDVNYNNPKYSYESFYGVLYNKEGTELIRFPVGSNYSTHYSIPEDVTSICDGAFRDCKKLTSISIPASVTNIGTGAFDGCSSLTRVEVENISAWCAISFGDYEANPLHCGHILYMNGNPVTDLMIPNMVSTIGAYTFAGCTSLTSVYLPKCVSSIGEGAFSSNTNLKTVHYAGTQEEWNSITFGAGNEPLTGLTPSCNENISDYCAVTVCDNDYGTLSVDKSLAKKGEVVTISSKMKDDYIVKTYLVDGVPITGNSFTAQGDTAVINMEAALPGNFGENITWVLDMQTGELTVSGAGMMKNYVYTGSPLSGHQDDVKKVVIENGITTVGEYVFWGCTSLTDVTLPDSITKIGEGAFGHCLSMTSITIPASLTDIGKGAFTGCQELHSLTLGNSVKTIGDDAFFGCESLTSVTMGNQLQSIGNNAFYMCSKLTSVVVPASVTSMGISAFGGCNSLEEITLPFLGHNATDTDNKFDYVFGKDYEGTDDVPETLKKITILTANLTINAFDGLYFVEEINLPGCENLTVIPENCFRNCEWLAKLTFGSEETDGVVIPDSVVEIGNNAFAGCRKFTSMTLDRNLQIIGDSAFALCDGLESINIPASVTSIGSSAFISCEKLTRVDITDLPAWCAIAFGGLGADISANPMLLEDDHGERILRKNLYLNGKLLENAGMCGDNMWWVLDEGVLYIYGAFNMYDYWKFTDAPWYDNRASITSVNIGKDVFQVSYRAFGSYTDLTKFSVAADNRHHSSDDSGVLFTANKDVLWRYPTGNSRTVYTVPDSVTCIGSYAFCGSTALEEIRLPENLENGIVPGAFSECENLRILVFPGTTPIDIGEGIFSDLPNDFKIYVPTDCVAKYKSAWLAYESHIIGIHHQPTDGEGYTINYKEETISVEDEYEVSTRTDFATKLASGTSVTPGETYYVRMTGSGTMSASAATGFTLPNRPATPTGLTVVQETVKGKKDAVIRGVTSAMEYKRGNDDWTNCVGNEITNPDNETVRIRFNVTGSSFAGEVQILNFLPSEMLLTATFTSVAGQENTPAPQSVAYGEKLSEPQEPTRPDYSFGGWYKEADCEHAWNFDNDIISSGTTLYPKWTPIEYVVTFDAAGGTCPVTSTNVPSGAKITVPTTPTATGYTFGGWYKEASCTNVWNFATDTVSTNTTLYAKWTEKKAALIYIANGHGTTPTNVTMKYTEAAGATSMTNVKGYTFNGWNTMADGTGTPYAADAVVKAAYVEPTATTLYAQWKANTYSITYKDKGGEIFSGAHESGYPTTHTYDTATTLKKVTKSGYTFDGWYATPDCTGDVFTSLGATAYTDDITLYAKWTKNSSGSSGSGAVTPAVTMPLIRMGNRGDTVKVLQTKLNALGYNCGTVDGIFGGKTYAAVVAFQKGAGVAVDGIVGPQTWTKLYGTGVVAVTTVPSAIASGVNVTIRSNMPLITAGSKGDAVKALQIRLNALGYDCGKVDGIFGQKTLSAVKAYQTDHTLLVDGMIGEQTWGALR